MLFYVRLFSIKVFNMYFCSCTAGEKIWQKNKKSTLITRMTMSCVSFVLKPIKCFGEEIQRQYMGHQQSN